MQESINDQKDINAEKSGNNLKKDIIIPKFIKEMVNSVIFGVKPIIAKIPYKVSL